MWQVWRGVALTIDWELKRCPLYRGKDRCTVCDDNKDRNILWKHLFQDHAKEELAEFITSGVEDH
jgi:hypothetical protein